MWQVNIEFSTAAKYFRKILYINFVFGGCTEMIKWVSVNLTYIFIGKKILIGRVRNLTR